ncbi:hypothetical protein GH722_06245 [Alphaproteobacteria bacterium HT1-32]|nr:hypothetical protein [Alphaproteobacteria bacterium HT1-32]
MREISFRGPVIQIVAVFGMVWLFATTAFGQSIDDDALGGSSTQPTEQEASEETPEKKPRTSTGGATFNPANLSRVEVLPPLLSYSQCELKLPDGFDWTPQEIWAWEERACLGERIDMRVYYEQKYGRKFTCRASRPDYYPVEAELSANFIQTMIRQPLYKRLLHDRGIEIYCARIRDEIRLNDSQLHRPLIFGYSRLEKGGIFVRFRSESILAIIGSVVSERLEGYALQLASDLLLSNGSRFEKDVRLTGARVMGNIEANKSIFDGTFRLNNADVGRNATFNGSRMNAVLMASSRFGFNITAVGATFSGPLNMTLSRVEGSVNLRGGSHFRDIVTLDSALVQGNVYADSSRFEGLFNLSSAEIERSVLLDKKSTFNEVRMASATIGRNVNAESSTFNGPFIGDLATIGGTLIIRNGALFKDIVRFPRAKIAGSLEAASAVFEKPIDFYGININGGAFLKDESTFKDVNLSAATIGDSLQLTGSTFDGRLDLTNATIARELHLTSPLSAEDRTADGPINHPPPIWTDKAHLILRNVTAGAIQDTASAWDNLNGRLDLVGLTYERLGGLRSTRDSTMAARDEDWLLDWLSMQQDREFAFMPQPYEQLGRILRQTGQTEKGEDILYALRDHERTHDATTIGIRLWLTFTWLFIGYGYEVLIVVLWLFALMVGGGMYIYWTPVGRQLGLRWCLFYSLDMSIPFVDLNPEEHWALTQTMSIGTQIYTGIHRIVALILASFLAAGMSGMVG